MDAPSSGEAQNRGKSSRRSERLIQNGRNKAAQMDGLKIEIFETKATWAITLQQSNLKVYFTPGRLQVMKNNKTAFLKTVEQ
jgi:hypothetical protein